MNVPSLVGLDFLAVVDGIAEHVEYSTQRLFAYRHAYSLARIVDGGVAFQAVGGRHCDTTHHVVAYMLSHFNGEFFAVVIYLQSVVNCRQMPLVKRNVDDRSHNLRHSARIFF